MTRLAAFTLITAVTFLGPAARASEAAAPVVAVMKIVSWASAAHEGREYEFGDRALAQYYTKDFQRHYREARRLIREAEDPFVTNPIVGGQDHCTLSDISFEETARKSRTATIEVRYLPYWCTSGTAEQRNQKQLTLFHARYESGRWRIDDIVVFDTSFKRTLIAGAERARARNAAERRHR